MVRIKYILEYLTIKILFLLFSLLPINTASRFGAFLMLTFGSLIKKNKRAIDHVDLVLENVNSKKIISAMWCNLGRNLTELLLLKKILKEKHRFKYNLPHIVNPEVGNIYITAHFSNWELSAVPLMYEGYNVSAVYRNIKNPYINNYLYNLRSNIFKGGLLDKHKTSAQELIKNIKAKKNILLLCDQREFKGIDIPFLGKECSTMTVPAVIALKTGAKIFAIKVTRERNVNYTYDFIEIPVAKGVDNKSNIKAIMNDINNIYSEWITESPEDWLWTHKRWLKKENK
ncbi:MAG: lysophospholipid acyltransferase family protein [Alphaproteobacteria bacterium]|jgi:KDO2-lipid IV(A) lauroyltransferase